MNASFRDRDDPPDAGPIRVVACVVLDGDAFLVCRRPRHKRHGGLWEFPGGKVEPGEADAHAAERELAEELGVRVHTVGATLFERADPGSPYLIVFVPVTISGVPTPTEHDAIAWARPAELRALPLAPSDHAFVDHLLASDDSPA